MMKNDFFVCNKWIVLLFSFLVFFSIVGSVNAGTIEIDKDTRALGQVTIKDLSCSPHKVIYSELTSGGVSYDVPNECKLHELEISLSWRSIASPQTCKVICRMYNGGNMSLYFGLDWWGSKAMTYSYVYGNYSVKNSDGNLLEVYKVTEDQAHTKSYKNYITAFTWGKDNQILYHPNIGANTSTARVGETFEIFGHLTETNPSYNGVPYRNNLGGVKFDLKINNEVYQVTTNRDGGWSCDYTPQNSGKHIIEAHWTGNSTHPMFKEKIAINVAA